MKKIGLTGGIGSGKTTVAKFFELLDVPVFYSDIEAKQIINYNYEVKEQIIFYFGDVYNNFGIDNKKLAQIVFTDNKKLEILNSIVHPVVQNNYENWIKNFEAKPYTIKEAAILFESGNYLTMDKIITVTAPLSQRIQRVLDRDKTTLENIMKRIEKQWLDEKKVLLSHFVIKNDDNTLVLEQILKIHNYLLKI